MPAVRSEAMRGPEPRKGKKYFTLAEARRALPLVKRIALDVQAVQGQRVMLHETINARIGQTAAEVEALRTRFEHATDKLERLIEELNHIGVELKDPGEGLLDFPALFQGREILLCWKAGEETITHWHELDAGFGGRKPVGLLE